MTGDAMEMLAPIEPASISVCVTDPPYGLKFMGRAWDRGVPGVPYWQAVHCVLKPGAWLLAFGGTRTHHRLMCAIEDAGFEIRDCLMWLYGSGFPKGKGCLKPGWEPIVLARKRGPLRLNVDGCRLEGIKNVPASPRKTGNSGYGGYAPEDGTGSGHDPTIGRWPANVVLSHELDCRKVGTRKVRTGIHVGRNSAGKEKHRKLYSGGMPESGMDRGHAAADGTETVATWECVESCAVRLLDTQSGTLQSGSGTLNRHADKFRNSYGDFPGTTETMALYGDRGGASRFFYCAKASTRERNAGMPEGRTNQHPTVKPLSLMCWLLTLVVPPGGTVLDPFCGSGSTLIAADRLGFDAIGIDSDPHAIEIARGRLQADAGPMFADQVVAS
jgi:hypothetical protein